jgi:hypothetical protein
VRQGAAGFLSAARCGGLLRRHCHDTTCLLGPGGERPSVEDRVPVRSWSFLVRLHRLFLSLDLDVLRALAVVVAPTSSSGLWCCAEIGEEDVQGRGGSGHDGGGKPGRRTMVERK